MKKYIVEQGNSIEIIWKVKDLCRTESGGITLDFSTSHANLIKPDNTVENLVLGKNVALIKKNDSDLMTAEVNISDSNILPLGKTKYEIKLVHIDGHTMLDESGTIEVIKAKSPLKPKIVRPWDLLNPKEEHASEELRNSRMSICNSCPRLKLGVCTSCGCVMKLKTTLSRAVCPEGKW
jgi:hypothetical protein